MKEILILLARYEKRANELWYQTSNKRLQEWYDGYAKALSMVQRLLKDGIVK